jgi:hypothetical protein
MAAMTDAEILTAVKNGAGISGDYLNDTLTIYINDVVGFMVGAGVPESVTKSSAAVGCIVRGVLDLWDYGNGTAKLSEYLKMRVTQLALTSAETDEEESGGD